MRFKSFGLPYQGSKRRIAEAIINNLPSNHCFVDLFAGGCSVAHVAALSGKYEKLIINDFSPSAQDWLNIMRSVLDGDPFRYVYYIAKDRLKNDHGINTLMKVAFSYSYISTGAPYYVQENYEKVGKDFFDDVFSWEVLKNGDLTQAYSRFRSLSPCYRRARNGYDLIIKPVQAILSCLMTMYVHPVHCDSIQCFTKSYSHVQIPDGACVYCDIPYYGTAGYGSAFCHRDFYFWASSVARTGAAIFVSEYRMPPEFRQVLSIPVCGRLCSKNKPYHVHEKLFTI